MMTYQQFKEYLARFVWRDGDTAFEAELDNFIALAHARLRRDLRIQKMVRTQFSTITDASISLPDDYLEARVVASDTAPSPLEYVTPHEMERLRTPRPDQFQGVYTVVGDRFRFAGANVEDGREITLTYYADLPDFETTDTSWLADEYLDLYTYAVLRHTASYLRDDDRVALWQNEYAETLMSVMADEAQRRYAGSPLTVRLPGNVA